MSVRGTPESIIKNEKEEFSQREKIKVENDLDSKGYEASQIAQVFIKDERNHSIDTDDTVSDRIYNGCDTMVNFDPTVFEMQDDTKELQMHTDNNKYQVADICEQVMIIKKENVEYENTENVSNSITNEHNFTYPWMKCEVVEELPENDLGAETCEITGITDKNEDDHILKKNLAEGGHKKNKCIHCNQSFRYKRTLNNHIINKHPEYIASVSSKIHECTHCSYKTTIKDKFTRHILKHPGPDGSCKLSVCIHCNRTFIDKSNLDDHIIKKHPEHIASVLRKILECSHCTYKTIIKRELDNHILRKHPEYIASVLRKVLECAHCTYKTTIKRELDSHIIKKHPEYIASVSSKLHECKYCPFKATSKCYLARHMWKHPGAEGSCEPKTCIYCHATFKWKKNLDNHIIKNHPEYIASVSSKIHECTHCSYKTTLKSELTKHMLKHPDAISCNMLNVCNHCNTTFMNKINLNDHIMKKHPEHAASVSRKIHECKYCEYKTTLKGHLAEHMAKHPEAESELKSCIHCNGTFRSKAVLDNHIIKEHPNHIASISSKIHECKYCEFKTTLKDRLAKHMGKHPGAEGGYDLKTCTHCNATFKSKKSLDNHTIKKHPNDVASVSSKIHECNYCTYKTTTKGHLAIHMEKHPDAESVSYERKTCIHCNATFKHKTDLDDHIIKKHPEYIASVSSKVHECPYCAYKTTIKRDFTRHMLKHPDAAYTSFDIMYNAYDTMVHFDPTAMRFEESSEGVLEMPDEDELQKDIENCEPQVIKNNIDEYECIDVNGSGY
ncbi:unnamed protein product [Acanthoscelides obtectus]|uniref:C2H2-type domain-containing protein n=1 Tax=Acanthoscelides obtectus TaxID=200917 RepID=A0A9P0PY97_ACAOB|nr:unnamed protein product [Acanthoscelides obtectus]CAK1664857.1 Zinc finger autosomal protein [Acanthoscelides obtectus]